MKTVAQERTELRRDDTKAVVLGEVGRSLV